ncbi:hypothetical protein OsI_10117 [Oryza sativa Indica Group]|uniref:Uncharacterized protein n=1 Tax=Oryza sativa subsp. indica TaxID=39946 RepID=A2XCT3_ORYSI|nr:hypothetical protein OsI_10117 [Oryza sativa Indica Group]
MGKAGRWLRSFLAGGKKGGKKGEAMAAALPGEAAKEKRWSFRRPVHGEKAAAEAAAAADGVVVGEAEAGSDLSASESEFDQKRHAMAVALVSISKNHRGGNDADGKHDSSDVDEGADADGEHIPPRGSY